MRKLKLFFACLLMAVLSIGQMWGDSYTITLKNGTGSGDSSTGIQGSTTISDFVADGASYVSAVAGSGKVYQGASGYGLKFGNKDGGGSITLTLTESVMPTSIVINASQFGATEGTGVFQGTNYVMTDGGGKGHFNDYTVEYDGNTEVTTISVGCSKRGYVKSITVNYSGTTPPPSCTSEITISKADDPAKGTFTLDNSGTVCIDGGNATVNVTANPDTHYHLASVTTTGSVGTIGTISGNTCEITDIDADTEIGVTFAEDTKYQVTWNVNGNEDTKTNVYAGEKPVFPATPAACDATSTTFIGWATAPWTGKLDDLSEKTVYTSASDMPAVNAAVTYYAVFAKVSGTPSVTHTLTISGKTAASGYASRSETDDKDATWSGVYNYGDETHIGLNKKSDNHYLGSPLFDANVTSVKATIKNGSSSARSAYLRSENETAQPSSGDLGSVSVPANDEKELTFTLGETAFKQFYVYVSDPLQFHEFIVTLEGSATYSDYMTTCCTQYNVNITAGIENGSVSADPTAACEGATVTLTFTPALNYHLSAWTLNGVEQDIAENTFEMPGADVTVSATFAEDACTPLGTPSVDVSGKAYPYNAVKLAWSAITNADSYKVYIYDAEDNELEHNDAVTGVEYTIGQTLSASTTYKYSVQAISNTPATYCPSVAATSSFVTEALPTAHLTLFALGEEQQASGDYSILTPFNLPSTAASCAKTFVGWDANSECASAPTYAKGAEFTFQNTDPVTLYAVYADETPGEATLTKLGSGATFADGDKLVIAAKGTNFGIYFENAGSAYVKNWEFAGADPVLSELTDSKKILTLVKSGDNWKFGDATNGYFYSSGSNNLEISTTNSSEFNSFSWNTTESAFTITKTDGRYLNCRTDLTSGNKNLWRFNGTNTNNGSPFLNVYKYAIGESTYDNYSTECLENVATPTITPDGSADYYTTAQNVTITAEDGATIYYTTDGTTPTTGSTKYTEAISLSERGEYTIKAIAVKTGKANSDVAEAVIKINLPFANLAELVEANIVSGSEVIVSFADEVITDDQYISQGTKRAGLMLTTKAANNKAIEIFYNKGTTAVPAEWVIGGSLSANAKTFTWTLYGDQWELVPLGNDWTWDNGDLVYTAPKEVSSVVVSGEPTKQVYTIGETFDPEGLTVTINYSDNTHENNPVGVTFITDPENGKMALEQTSIKVKATFNTVTSKEWFTVNGLTVNDLETKTIAQFVAAGGGRCYLIGTVSNITNTQYGNFDLTDASGTIFVYGCLDTEGQTKQFANLNVEEDDYIKVIADTYVFYNNKDQATNVQFVEELEKPVIPVESITLAEGQDAVTIKETKTLQLEATVNPTTASNKNLTWESSDATIASVDENGKVTAEAIGNATITVKSVADPTITATCEVTVIDATARTTGNAVFQKVTTTTDITDGEYLIVYAEADKDSVAFDGALETLDAAFNTIDVIVDGNFIVAPEDASFTIDVTNGTIKAYSGDYIGVTSYSNGLKQDEDASTYPAHSFTIDENEYAIISLNNSWTNPMILNYNSGVNDQRFRYYKNGSQKKIQLFKKVEATEIRTGLYDGKWGTICPAQKVMLPTGASFYTLTYMEMQGDMPYKLFFDEIETDYLEGGKPYLFIAEGETIMGVRGTNAAEAQNYNGFYGNISGSTIHIVTEQNAYIAGNDVINYYGLTNNTFTLLPDGTTVQHERAVVQVKNGALNCPEPVLPAPARPGARRVVAGNNAPAVATGCDEINASEVPVKVMINGQLFIIRGEKMFDATGRLVK